MTASSIKSRGVTAQAIASSIEALRSAQPPRDYIGASIIGTKCDRALFYTKERVEVDSPTHRVLRIFEFGDVVELLVVKWLRQVGWIVYDEDPRTNDQLLIRAHDRAYQGHVDGIISSVSLMPVLFGASTVNKQIKILEAKSHKDNQFENVIDLGVEVSHFEHYAQLQTYMGESEQLFEAFGLTGTIHDGLYVAVNKNTSEVYCEEVPFDHDCFLRLASRARRVNRASAPPPRLAEKPTLQPCKYCDYKIHCFADQREEEILDGARDASTRDAGGSALVAGTDRIRDPKRRLSNVQEWDEVKARRRAKRGA